MAMKFGNSTAIARENAKKETNPLKTEDGPISLCVAGVPCAPYRFAA
jgi:hypothetical protein